MENKFSLFIPIEIEKSNKTGEEKYANMKFKGIASNPNMGDDKQGQWLDPSGFDYNDLLKSGHINFHHLWKDKPLAIIGEPTKASLTKNNEFYIEGKLYKDSKLAREVYDLAELLEKNSNTRRLGFSIEGIPLVKDPLNENRIIKARISNVAITPSPVCPGTKMELMKGGIDDIKFEIEEGKEFLIDIVQDNIRYTVDKNLEIQKAIVAGDSTGRDTTNQVSNGDTLKQEDIDSGKKKRTKKLKEEIAKKDFFSKSETALLFFSMFTDVDSVKNIYSLTEQVQRQLTPNMEVTKISKEAIQKALVTLNLVEATPEVDKAKEEADKKALIKSEYEETIKKAEELKAKLEGKEVTLAKTEITTAKVEEPKKDETLEKAIAQVGALGVLVNASRQENEELKKANDDLVKSIGEIKQFTTSLAEKLGMIEKQPLDRKSITTQSYIEKGGEAAVNGMKDVKTLSISNAKNREEVANVLFKAAVASGVNEAGTSYKDQELVKAVSYVELGSFPPQDAARIQTRLLKEFKINLVK